MMGAKGFVLGVCVLVWFAQGGTCQGSGGANAILQQITALLNQVNSIITNANQTISSIQTGATNILNTAGSQIQSAVDGLNSQIADLQAQAAAAGKDISSCVNTAQAALSNLGVGNVLNACDPSSTITAIRNQITALPATAATLAGAEAACILKPFQYAQCLQNILNTATSQVSSLQTALAGVTTAVQNCATSAVTTTTAQISNIQSTLESCAQGIIGITTVDSTGTTTVSV